MEVAGGGGNSSNSFGKGGGGRRGGGEGTVSVFGVPDVSIKELNAYVKGKVKGVNVNISMKKGSGKAYLATRSANHLRQLEQKLNGTSWKGSKLSARIIALPGEGGGGGGGGGGGTASMATDRSGGGGNGQQGGKRHRKKIPFKKHYSNADVGAVDGALAGRYAEESAGLMLDSLGDGPEWNAVAPNFANSVFVDVLITRIGANVPHLAMLSLRDNNIRDLSLLKRLGSAVPDLKLLSLGANNITSWKELDLVAGMFPGLIELELAGNPITAKISPEDYHWEVMRRFPELLVLDGMDTMPTIKFALPEAILASTRGSAGIPSQGSFAHDGVPLEMTQEFLTKFFEIYDSENRNALLDAYHKDASCFSLTAEPSGNGSGSSGKGRNKRKKRRSQKGRKGDHDDDESGAGADPTLEDYLPFSRNLLEVSNTNERMKRVQCGNLDIISTLAGLRRTTHDLSTIVVDQVLVPLSGSQSLVIVSLHGLVMEVESQVIRSFDRVLTLQPAEPESLAMREGWNLIVINDRLHLRPAVPDSAVLAGPSDGGGGGGDGGGGGGGGEVDLSPAQQQLVRELGEATPFSLEFCATILDGCGWDPSATGAALEEMIANNAIPDNAYA